MRPNTLADIWNDIRSVAAALDVVETGEPLVERLNHRLSAISVRALASPRRPAVACLEWVEPLMAAGNSVSELVEMAGTTLTVLWSCLVASIWSEPRRRCTG